MIYVNGFCKLFEKSFLCCLEDSFSKKSVESSFVKLSEIFQEIWSFKTDLNIFSVSFSWCHFLLCNDNEAYLCGFLNGKCGQVIHLKTPNTSKIIQGCCSSNHCHLVTERGDYWLYSINTREWKNINQLLGAEKQNETSGDGLMPISKPLVYKISCGDYMTIAVTDSGLYSVPLLLTFPQLKVLDVSCGKEHTLLLTEHSSVFSWGSGSRGQLGHGELETEEQPRELSALSGLKVIAVAAGGWHSCCITEHGDLYSWGWNCSGQLGFPGEDHPRDRTDIKANCVVSVLAEPRPVDWPDELSIVKQVSCGSQHTMAVLDDGSVWGCGWNRYGQLMSDDLPEKVFCMTKLCVPDDRPKDRIRVVCGQWNSALIF